MIVILSDGMANDDNVKFNQYYKQLNMDIPIFSIMFEDAQEEQLNELARLPNGRIFDGRQNMLKAFQTVKGYN